MITEERFLEIVKNNLMLRKDGSVIILDKAVAKEFADYLTQFASKTEEIKSSGSNLDNTPDEAWVELNWNCPRKPSK